MQGIEIAVVEGCYGDNPLTILAAVLGLTSPPPPTWLISPSVSWGIRVGNKSAGRRWHVKWLSLLAQMWLQSHNTSGDWKAKDKLLLACLQALKWFGGRR